MNSELRDSFNEYLKVFKQMDVASKRREIIFAINEITASFDSLAKQINVDVDYLSSKEISELKNGDESEDDYLEALLVYIENAKLILGQYLLKITENKINTN